MQWKYLDDKGQETNDIFSAETLWLKNPQASEMSRGRSEVIQKPA